MSIYGTNRGGWRELNDIVQTVPRAQPAAASPAPDSSPANADATDWTSVRKARPAEYMLPLTEKWFDAFPADKAPCALVSQYPRVANMIAVQWRDRRGAPELFDDLLTDKRGGRAGFPPAVRRDLMMLQEYWYRGQLRF
jgi:hypothetical protein